MKGHGVESEQTDLAGSDSDTSGPPGAAPPTTRGLLTFLIKKVLANQSKKGSDSLPGCCLCRNAPQGGRCCCGRTCLLSFQVCGDPEHQLSNTESHTMWGPKEQMVEEALRDEERNPRKT
ncbi:uncharacterized protein LOC118152909 [Callithrix jacchus]